MKRFIELSLACLITLLITACSSKEESATSPAILPVSPTAPITQPTVINLELPTSTKASLTTSDFTTHCVSLIDLESEFLINSGSIIFSSPVQALSRTNKKPVTLATIDFASLSISPYDGTMAWFDNNQNLQIKFSNGSSKVIHRPQGYSFTAIRQWLLNNRLIIDFASPRTSDSPIPAQDEFYLVDLSMETVEPITLEFEGFFARDTLDKYYQFWHSVPLYSPDFSGAVYVQQGADPLTSYTGLSVWNISNQRKIKSLDWKQAVTVHLTPYTWKVNTTSLFAFGPDKATSNYALEVLEVRVDGQVVPLTTLNRTLNGYYAVRQLKWSPDGKRLLMVLETFGEYSLVTHLYILDTSQSIITDYCMSPSFEQQLYWSPDSSQIVFIQNDKDVVVLDIPQAKAQIVAQAKLLAGWVDWEP